MNIGANFNIANFMKNADAKERAMVYFNDMGSIMTKARSLLKDSERDALHESFKTNQEVDLHNRYLCYFRGFQFCISEIDHFFTRISERKTAFTSVLVTEFKHGRIEDEIMLGFYNIMKSNLIQKKNKKKLQEMMDELMVKVDACSIQKDLKRINSMIGKGDDEENGIKAFARSVKARIEEDLVVIDYCQQKFKSEYEDLGVKFAVIEEKMDDNTKEVLLVRSYVEDMCNRFLKDDDKASA